MAPRKQDKSGKNGVPHDRNSLPIIMVKWINPTGAMQSDLNNPKG
jgi:hypothetical protein